MSTAADGKLLMELRRTAMDLLARREHSRSELVEKLQRKYSEASRHFLAVLDQLEQDGLLSDERFAEAYVRYRRSRGFGPLLIRQELRGKGIDAMLLDAVIDIRAEEWLDTLRELINKKRRLYAALLNKDAPPWERTCSRMDDAPHQSRAGSAPAFQDASKTRQKLYRLCLSRGFTSEQIERAMR
ncbi:MAG: regulatory protein RecX [Gammaproteobacteria bacterium]|nr:regulatory protein RecX [Gammaproteobacteria bacterium]MDP2140982.1 regulatory protein RecX [Gammaproteobacteria bacterium]MDP2349274.1 regulatory protein RecX [Gammaproteobacteria bacterium]